MAWETLAVALMALIIGAAFCFGGYKWFMILLPIWGFVTGFSIGAYSISGVYGESLLSIVVIVVAGAILGLIFAVLAYLLFPAAVILLGASLGYTAAWTIVTSLGFSPGLIPVAIGIAGAIALAILAVRYHLPKYIIIVSTAMLGSIGIIMGILLLMGEVTLEGLNQGLTQYLIEASATWPVAWLALAVIGLLVQLRRAWTYEMDLSSQQMQS
jgi:hypothetical protein